MKSTVIIRRKDIMKSMCGVRVMEYKWQEKVPTVKARNSQDRE